MNKVLFLLRVYSSLCVLCKYCNIYSVAFLTKYINHCRLNNNNNITCFPPLVILFSVLEKPHVCGLNGFLSQLVNYLKGCA